MRIVLNYCRFAGFLLYNSRHAGITPAAAQVGQTLIVGSLSLNWSFHHVRRLDPHSRRR